MAASVYCYMLDSFKNEKESYDIIAQLQWRAPKESSSNFASIIKGI